MVLATARYKAVLSLGGPFKVASAVTIEDRVSLRSSTVGHHQAYYVNDYVDGTEC